MSRAGTISFNWLAPDGSRVVRRPATLAAIVRDAAHPARLWALTCRHAAQRRGPAPSITTTTGALLCSAAAPLFAPGLDAALLPIPATALALALSAVPGPSPHHHEPEFPAPCSLCTLHTSAGPIDARVVRTHPIFDRLRGVPSLRNVLELLLLTPPTGIPATTRPGDSGCPILSTDGHTFLGMHLGGIDDTSTIFAHPASALMNKAAWAQCPDGLEVVSRTFESSDEAESGALQ